MSTNSRHSNGSGRDSFRDALNQPTSQSLRGARPEVPAAPAQTTIGREPAPIVLEADDALPVDGFAAEHGRPRHHRVAYTSVAPPPDDVRAKLLALVGPVPV